MLLTSNHTHLLNLLFMWKIIAEIHPSICYWHQLLLLTNCLQTSYPESFYPPGSLPWRGPRRIREFSNKLQDRWESFFETDILCSSNMPETLLVKWCEGCKIHCLVNQQDQLTPNNTQHLKCTLWSLIKLYLSLILLSYPRCLQTCSMYVFLWGGGGWGRGRVEMRFVEWDPRHESALEWAVLLQSLIWTVTLNADPLSVFRSYSEARKWTMFVTV